MVLWRPIRSSRANTPKRCPFHYRGLEYKSSKSRDTWSNKQVWPWSTKWSRAKKNLLAREHTGHSNTLSQQHKRRLYTWTSPDGQHQKQIDYILCNQRCRSSIQSAKTRLGADCGSGHELTIAKFRLKLKEVGKTTRPFKYDLNQIPYYYMVEMTNFKGFKIQGIRSDRVPVSSKPGKRIEHFWIRFKKLVIILISKADKHEKKTRVCPSWI